MDYALATDARGADALAPMGLGHAWSPGSTTTLCGHPLTSMYKWTDVSFFEPIPELEACRGCLHLVQGIDWQI
jgi:hypothetical protein